MRGRNVGQCIAVEVRNREPVDRVEPAETVGWELVHGTGAECARRLTLKEYGDLTIAAAENDIFPAITVQVDDDGCGGQVA